MSKRTRYSFILFLIIICPFSFFPFQNNKCKSKCKDCNCKTQSKGHSGILGRLKTVCLFPEVFEDLEPAGSPYGEVPRRKIGHIRADYDGYRWWSTAWPLHGNLAKAEVTAEIDRTYEALTAKDALADLDTLRRFCWSHPEAQCSPNADDEFNFYLMGERCDFWVRLITREKDYNMYLHAYAKEVAK